MQPRKSGSERRLAFFDADETVLAMKSLMSFLRFYLERTRGTQAAAIQEGAVEELARARARGATREELNAAFYLLFAGEREEKVRLLAREWHEELRRSGSQLYLPGTTARLRALVARGYEVFFVSGSFEALLEPFARELGMSGIVCSRPESIDGVLTGWLLGAPMIGQEKARAARELIRRLGANREDCFACGDDISDVPLLETVGRAAIAGSQPQMVREAAARGWERL